jgi:hypothetical protein
MVGTLTFDDVYPGLKTADSPMPELKTTDQKSSAKELEGAPVSALQNRAAMWFIALAALMVVLRHLMGGE